MSCLFIAEVSSNHHKDLARCLEFVDVAAASGCAAVKFQLFKIDQLFSPEVLAGSEQHRRRKEWELPLGYLAPIAQRCREQQIQFSCTPFYLDAVKALEPFVDFYKIASYELLWDDLLIACAKTNKPVILSVGMATIEEIDHAVAVLQQAGCQQLTLLHCVSAYPTPIDECNLAVIETLRQRYHCAVGWSDHSRQPAVLHRAVQQWRAEVIEFHIDLDGQGEEYQAGHCWLPEQISAVTSVYQPAPPMDGNGIKTVAASELPDRDWRADPRDGLRPLLAKRKNWNTSGL
ncbi:N-acetylneuraminate synthase family protein [Dasania marina]|uniref:N-acetylneuraminate synthase family protein n=1 Tax=Dasania marina TaxID=471499 RepID=UPI000379051C|nr:N-acetylneuraminate synthase family protein [Dasania marina]